MPHLLLHLLLKVLPLDSVLLIQLVLSLLPPGSRIVQDEKEDIQRELDEIEGKQSQLNKMKARLKQLAGMAPGVDMAHVESEVSIAFRAYFNQGSR